MITISAIATNNFTPYKLKISTNPNQKTQVIYLIQIIGSDMESILVNLKDSLGLLYK